MIDWNLAKNKISNYEYDAVEAGLAPEKTANSRCIHMPLIVLPIRVWDH